MRLIEQNTADLLIPFHKVLGKFELALLERPRDKLLFTTSPERAERSAPPLSACVHSGDSSILIGTDTQ